MLYLFFKRISDSTAALVGLIVLMPLLLAVGLALRFTGEGEILFAQTRRGYRNRIFKIYKFATMLRDSPHLLTGDITLRDDPRVTTLGHALRRSKLNELPQLLNVLRGDMSFVGPRPLMPVGFEKYAPAVKAIIYDSRPGITGIGSLVFRDEDLLVTAAAQAGIEPMRYYEEVIYPYKGELELWYHQRRGLWTDLKILVATALSLLLHSRDWAYLLFRDLPRRPTNFWARGTGRTGG